MKILQVHKYLYRKAGAETYFLDLAQLLLTKGHEVGMWGTHPPLRHSDRAQRVEESRAIKDGIPRLRSTSSARDDVVMFDGLLIEERHFDRREGLWRDLKKFGQMVWSRNAARKFERVLEEFKPEVVHLHNIYHHISPSILPVAERHNVPVVMTVHDYHLINPNYSLFDHGEICERNGWRAIAHRCIKNSYAAAFADVLEWRVHRMLRVYEKHVAKFLAPTEFVKRKLTGSGIPHEKIIQLPLPVILNEPRRSGGSEGSRAYNDGIPRLAWNDRIGSYVLFAGRLAVEKGIYLLLEIAKQLPDIQFKIAGTGPEIENVKCKIKNGKLLNVELLGFLERDELQRIIVGARIVLVPSLWYEVSPLSVLEAMAAGKTVVASAIGGIPELIEDGETGFLVAFDYAALRSGNKILFPELVEGWIDKIKKIYYDEKLLKRLGKAAKEHVKRAHNPQAHYEKIMEIYRKISNSPNF